MSRSFMLLSAFAFVLACPAMGQVTFELSASSGYGVHATTPGTPMYHTLPAGPIRTRVVLNAKSSTYRTDAKASSTITPLS